MKNYCKIDKHGKWIMRQYIEHRNFMFGIWNTSCFTSWSALPFRYWMHLCCFYCYGEIARIKHNSLWKYLCIFLQSEAKERKKCAPLHFWDFNLNDVFLFAVLASALWFKICSTFFEFIWVEKMYIFYHQSMASWLQWRAGCNVEI